ncbi:HD domain-containing protein [Pollutibacter soli]|uniref:HD domain-containing protein n=1 Tax=Pollutibacter soli TaxID=3034157 RepID=UPI0030137633
MQFRKIINDPVYGFITIDDELIYKIISHPWYQRLRRIKQMALSHLVYPGAVHTRLHHSLGAYHLMRQAIYELKGKGIDITPEEEQAAKITILLHDVGHGPFSHALESVLIEDVHHEELSILIMKKMNEEFGGGLSMAIEIFTDKYPKKFLHQLVSGQLDVDRMDYLTRDSFFTGVSEGVISYSRILKMLTVYKGELMVEEKGIYSIEEFLISRRLMYWQVYLHKTVLCSEMMLVKIFQRARELAASGDPDVKPDSVLGALLFNELQGSVRDNLALFCQLDDTDVTAAVKIWGRHKDPILSLLCNAVLNRTLFKLKLQAEPIDPVEISKRKRAIKDLFPVSDNDLDYLVFTGEAENSLYDPKEERINIVFRDGTVKDISLVDNALIHQNLSLAVKKFYICYYKPE